MPVLYVIAGPNGIGKTTSSYNLVPSNIPIINSDEIAKELGHIHVPSVNMQEYSNREATRLVDEQMINNNSFAIETNLSDQNTWKFLLAAQKTGYILHVMYLSTENLGLLNGRIHQRARLGGHFIRPDIVKERYINGLSLLKHYFIHPDKLQLFDNSESLILIAEFNSGKLLYKAESTPNWATGILDSQNTSTLMEKRSIKNMSIDEVRKLYKQTKSGKSFKDKNNKK